MSDLLYKTSIAVVPRLYVALSSLWFSTCRLEVRGLDNLTKVLAHGAGVVPFWHYSLFYMLHHLRQYPGVAMVSASRTANTLPALPGCSTLRRCAARPTALASGR